MNGSLRVVLVVLAVVGCLVSASFGAVVPQMINYQGTLTDKVGAPLADGNYTIEFKMYDVATGGTALWTEKWDSNTSPVVTVGGQFNVMLGNLVPIPTDFFAKNPITFLGIKVGTDSEMLPRQKITSVGYAFAAGNGVPKGGIIMWSGTTPPEGWALCNGDNGTPNLRDKFVIGSGNTYSPGVTGGEASHILSINEIPGHNHGGATSGRSADHTHNVTSNYTGYWEGYDSINWGFSNGSGRNFKVAGGGWSVSGESNDHVHTIPSQGSGSAHNNLPPYYALAFIMKL